ncbi:hypothetical protein IAT38_005354 [Cryptococcus sp. DSM 104549]
MDRLLLLIPLKCLLISREWHFRASRIVYRHLTMTDHVFVELCMSPRLTARKSLAVALGHTRTLRIIPTYRGNQTGYDDFPISPVGSPKCPSAILFPGVRPLELGWDNTSSHRQILSQSKLQILYQLLNITCPARKELVFYLDCDLIDWAGPRRAEVLEHLYRSQAEVITWVLWPKLPLRGEADEEQTGFYHAIPSTPLYMKTQKQRVVFDVRSALRHPRRARFVPPGEKAPSSVWGMVKGALWDRSGIKDLQREIEKLYD